MKKLLTAQTANISDAANAIVANGAMRLSIHAFGTWDTATLNVYVSLNGTTNGVLLPDLTFTDDGFVSLDVAGGTTIWAEVSSVGGSSSVNCWIAGMGDDT